MDLLPLARTRTLRVETNPKRRGSEKHILSMSDRTNSQPTVSKSPDDDNTKMSKSFENLDKLEEDLVMFSKNFQIQIKGGTLDKIIEQCTNESSPDNAFVDTFLLTYRAYLSAQSLLELLFRRYNPPPPESTDETEHILFQNSLKIIRLRLGNFIKRWLGHHYHDFDNPEMLLRLRELVEKTFMVDEISLGKSIMGLIDKPKTEPNPNPKTLTFDVKPPPPKSPSKSSINFIDFDTLECARQLCLYEQFMFKMIHTKECLNQSWNHKTHKGELAPNITCMIQHFNAVSNWIVSQIVREKNLEKRVKIVKKILRLSLFSYELNNYNACQEVIAGLGNASVFRLHKTWGKVRKDKKLWEDFEALKFKMAQTGNYKTYREVLNTANPPCLPYLGVFLTDLTFIEDGNSNYLRVQEGRDDIINFEKMRKVSLVIEKILIYKQQPYHFQKVDVIYDYFSNGLKERGVSEKDAYVLSIEIEPRS